MTAPLAGVRCNRGKGKRVPQDEALFAVRPIEGGHRVRRRRAATTVLAAAIMALRLRANRMANRRTMRC